MQQTTELAKGMKQKSDISVGSSPFNKSNSDGQRSVHPLSAKDRSHKDMLSIPPPPPPSRLDMPQNERKGIVLQIMKW